MTASLKPTCCPAWPRSFKNDLSLFTLAPLGVEPREPCHHGTKTQRRYPTSKDMLTLVYLPLHMSIPCSFRSMIAFSPRIIEMILKWAVKRVIEHRNAFAHRPEEGCFRSVSRF